MIGAFYLTQRQHALTIKPPVGPKPVPVTLKKKPRRRKAKR